MLAVAARCDTPHKLAINTGLIHKKTKHKYNLNVEDVVNNFQTQHTNFFFVINSVLKA